MCTDMTYSGYARVTDGYQNRGVTYKRVEYDVTIITFS